jgi:tetratricopeptide (TPR) repeat protein
MSHHPNSVGPKANDGTPAYKGRIVVATSFPPKLVRANGGRRMEDYDRLCVQSWIARGFKIISLNAPDEIAALALRHPEIDFIPTKRNASSVFGPRVPFIADLLSALAGQSSSVLGIINSDIIFEPAAGWQNLESLVAQRSVVTGQRCDTRSLVNGVLHRYRPGFDYFFFDREAAEQLAEDMHPFSMGLPWWDYWLPVILALRGYEIHCVARPAIVHLAHESQTEARSTTWRRLAVEFARTVIAEQEASKVTPANWDELLSLCRDLAKTSDSSFDSGEFDESIIHLSELSVSVITSRVVELANRAVAAPPNTAQAALESDKTFAFSAFFDDIPIRLAGGDALHKALWHENRQELLHAQHYYGLALERAPLDPGVLSACGNFCESRGDLERAAALFRRSVELLPDSGILLNSLGTALGELGRLDEAIACFEKAMNVDPLYAPSYYNLVIGLYPRGRHREIISRLENLMLDSNIEDGQDWLDRIHEALAQLENPRVRDAGDRAPR